MKRSCQYCGGIHPHNHKCARKPKREFKVTYIDKFRWTKPWQLKRKYIKDRDKHLCQICLRLRYHTQTQYNFTDIEVHHIDSIANAWDKRLDDDNLISLCITHHKMAERHEIAQDELWAIAKENNIKYQL